MPNRRDFLRFALGLLLGSSLEGCGTKISWQEEKPQAKVIVDDGVTQREIVVDLSGQMTAFEVLVGTGILVGASTHPSFGPFIEGIGKTKQNPIKNLYWLYYINGEFAQVGSGSYQAKPGDSFSWRYQTPL